MVVQIPDPLPYMVKNKLQKLVLSADIAYVDGMKIFITITQRLQFTTTQAIHDRTMKTIKECFDKVIRMYRSHGANISVILTDREFATLEDFLKDEYNITLNVSSANEHVPDIERNNCTLKERL